MNEIIDMKKILVRILGQGLIFNGMKYIVCMNVYIVHTYT